MYFVRSVYYWASKGCPDAVPAGIIGVNMGTIIDTYDDLKETSYVLSSIGIFDDTCWQLEFTQEDVDLIVKDQPDTKRFQTLSNDQILPDWQWELMKADPRVRVSEHHFKDYLDFIPPEEREQYRQLVE